MRYIYSILQKIVEFNYRNKNNQGSIFMFHQILQDGSECTNDGMSICKSDFYRFIKMLKQKGEIKSIENIDNFNNDENTYYLTFDDVYLNAYENALTWLCDNNIPFTIFVTTKYLDYNEYISVEDLKNLSKNKLCTIGAHTINHPLLRFKSIEETELEVINSKLELEKIIGKKVTDFAYPYGSKYACSKKNINIVSKSGYKRAFSTFSMGLNKNYILNNKFFIPRINVTKELIDKMEENYERNS